MSQSSMTFDTTGTASYSTLESGHMQYMKTYQEESVDGGK